MAKEQIKAAFEKIKKVKDDTLERNREALDKAYETRRPFAIARIEELRILQPTATPNAVIGLLEKDLLEAEKKFGVTTEQFSSAVMMYVISTLEVHQQATGKELSRGRIVDIMMIVDSRAVKGARKVLGGAIAVATFLPIGRGAKAVKTALKVGAAIGTAKVVLDKAKDAGKISQLVISSVKKTLGPVPVRWATEIKPQEKSKRKPPRK